MRSPRTARAAALLACLSLAGVLSACSSSHHDAQATSVKLAGSEAGPSSSTSKALPGTGTAQQRLSSETGTVSVPTQKVLARLSPADVKLYSVTGGSAKTKSRLTAATKSVKTTTTGVTYYEVTRGGQDVADIAVYRFEPEATTSKMFQAQIVDQLVTTAAKSHTVKFDKVSGALFTVAGKSPAAVGLFQGQSAVVVLGSKNGESLKSASAAAYAYLRS